MKAHRSGVFRFIFFFFLALLLIRFLPIAVRLIQMIAIRVSALWWAILPLLIVGGIIWKLKRRKLIAKGSEYRFGSQSPRDVTNSVADSSKDF